MERWLKDSLERKNRYLHLPRTLARELGREPGRENKWVSPKVGSKKGWWMSSMEAPLAVMRP